ncbi:YceD family protein [Guggenheimella bovis]
MKQLLKELLAGNREEIEIDELYKLPSASGNTLDVSVKGLVTNEGGRLMMSTTLTAEETLACDRCLVETTYRYFIPSYEEIDDIETFDLEAFAQEELVVSNPSQVLCSDDCKGLCPDCGADLNHEACHCKEKKTDPRLSALEQLLNE